MESEVEEQPQSRFQIHMYGHILDSVGHRTEYFQDTSNIQNRTEGDQQVQIAQSGQAKAVWCDVATLERARL
jgi:hypothetical protein